MSTEPRDIVAKLNRLADEHFRVLWLAGGTSAARSELIQAAAALADAPCLNLGKSLSSALLDIQPKLRPASAEDCFHDLLRPGAGEIRCLDRVDILFDQPLMLDAVGLIRNASRRFLILASWPGTCSGEMLSYAPAEHPSHIQINARESDCHFYHIS